MPATHGYQTADFDDREQARKHNRFQNAPRRHRAKRQYDHPHDEALREIDELLDVTSRPKRDSGGGNHAGHDG
jgi:hypothetical protein